MTIECYYAMCPSHGTHEGEEGPFCFQQDCTATPAEIQMYESGRKLQKLGYDREELDQDNPYTANYGDV